MRFVQPAFVGALVLLVAGCAGQADQAANPASNEQTSNEAIATAPSAETGDEELQFEGDAIAPSNELPDVEPIPPLLPPTSPEQRAAQVVVGRTDPFSPLPSAPMLVPNQSTAPQSPASLPTSPVPPLPNLPPAPVPTVPVPVQPPSGLPAQPPVTVTAPQQPPAPAVTTLPAVQTIQVSGVVEIAGQVSAIVSVPDEGSSRSVTVGDRIANGQVLIKRIDIGGGTPVVVLEQNGIEVMRSVSMAGG